MRRRPDYGPCTGLSHAAVRGHNACVTQTLCTLMLTLALALQGGSCRKQTMTNNKNTRAPRATSTATPSPPAHVEPRRVATGTWGGPHVRLDVTSEGARIEFDCAHGTLDAPLILTDGRFDVAGTFVLERGGPLRIDEVERGQPARFRGRVEGTRMTLTGTLTDTKEALDTFTLVHGAEADLIKCR